MDNKKPSQAELEAQVERELNEAAQKKANEPHRQADVIGRDTPGSSVFHNGATSYNFHNPNKGKGARN